MDSAKNIFRNNLFMIKFISKICPIHIWVTLTASLLGSVSVILNLLITRYIINMIQMNKGSDFFVSVVLAVLLLFSVDLLYIMVSGYIQQIVIPRNTQLICQYMHTELFKKSTEVEIKYYDDPEYFNTFSMVLQQADVRAQEVLNTFNNFVSSLIGVGTLGTLILTLEPVLLFLVAVDVFVSFLFNIKIANLQYLFSKKKVECQREMEYSKYIFYRTENAKELRLSGNIMSLLKDKFVNGSNATIDLINNYGRKICGRLRVQMIVNKLIDSIILLYLAFHAIKQKILIGDFSALTVSTQQLSSQLMKLINIFPEMYEHSLYIDNFKKFMFEIPKRHSEDGCEITEIKSVQMRNVSFSYPYSETESLQNINLELKEGEKIAIVGENGAGKSTLIKLLIGLYEASQGQILINDKEISTYNEKEYQECIGVVFQDYKVYALSIAENILMRKVEENSEDEELVKSALKFVGLYDKISELPMGIYTVVTKEFDREGILFSGGEMQKIVLARIYAKQNSLIVLDEPSSALDPIAGFEMMSKMVEISKNKCAIFISHQLESIKNFESIYVMSKGKMVECGNHEELMKRKGLYYEMFQKQKRGELV